MKKRLLFIVALILMLSIFSTGFAATIQVGDGTDTTSYFPFYGSYSYTYTQQIYTQAQVSFAGPITKISFYYVSGNIANNKDWTIYMGHTSKASFTGSADWEPLANLTQVFDGDVTTMLPPTGNWMEITLDTPFVYNNTDNLLIAVHQYTPGYSSMSWGAFTSESNTGIQFCSDTTNPDPGNPPSSNGIYNKINRIKLTMTATGAPSSPVLVFPEEGTQLIAGLALNWLSPAGSAGASSYDVYIDDNLVSGDQPGNTYPLPASLEPGTHSWYVVARNEIGVSPASESRTFGLSDGVLIGASTANQLHPFNAYSGYGRSLGLYTSTQIGQPGLITSLGWSVASTGTASIPYKIYAKITNDTALTPMTWDAFTYDATLIKEGSYNFDRKGWFSITLDNPFYYTGGNLLIGVEANYGGQGAGYGNYPRFHYSASTSGSHQNWMQDTNPPTANGNLNSSLPNLLIAYSPLPTNPVLGLSPTGWDFGNLLIRTSASRTFTISNNGSGTLNVTGINPSSDGHFTLTNAPSFPVTLGRGQTTTFSIQYAPTAGGDHSATFTITDESGATPFTVTGECHDPTIHDLPWLEDFTAEGFPPAEWARYIGLYPTDTLVPNTYRWVRHPFANISYPPNHAAMINIYSSTTKHWLVTPPIAIPAGNYQLDFDLALTKYNGATPVDPALQQDDRFLVLISDNHTMENATILREWNNTGSPHVYNNIAASGQYQAIDLSNHSGFKYIAFYGESTASDGSNAGDNNLYVDNVRVREMTGTTAVFAYTPATVDYGVVYNNTVSTQNVTVTNTGAGTLNLAATDVSIFGTDATMFEFDPDNLPFALSAYQNGVIPVRYVPTVEGIHTATLRMVYDGTNYDVALSGRSVGAFALVEGFEGVEFPPVRWAIHNGGGQQAWTRSTSKPRTGVAHARLRYDTIAHDDWLITPKLAPSATNHIISFYGCNNSTSYDDRFNVLVSTTSPDIASFTHTLATNVQTGAMDYMYHSYDLSSFIGQQIFVAIQAISTNQQNLMIDDVTGPDVIVSTLPSAPVLIGPSDGAKVYATQSLSWTLPAGSAEASVYDLYIDGILVSGNQQSTSYPLTGVALGTHSWYVVARNSAGDSPASETRTFEMVDPVFIGTGTSSQTNPVNAYYGYSRSLGLYTYDQIGRIGQINSLGWSVARTGYVEIPYKVYAKCTTETELTAMTWDAFTSEATLVKEGSDFFNSEGWHIISLDTPFTYSGDNLLIGVEANYGGTGAGSDSHPLFHYTTVTTNSHQYWQKDNTPPTTDGFLNKRLPNLLLTPAPLSADPMLSLNPTEWDFGRRMINTTSSRTFTIGNAGAGTLNVTGLSPASDGFFTLTEAPGLPLALNTNQAATFIIRYNPMAAGNHTATFTITFGSTTADITVSGECYDPTIASFPHLQTFDGDWPETPPAPYGWRVINANDDAYTWRQSNQYIQPTHSEPYAACGTGNTDDWLISPPINLTGRNVRVKWWDKVESSARVNSYKVMLSTTTSDTEAFTAELADIDCSNTAWTEHTLGLDAYNGQTIYLAFYQYASANPNYGFGIDDFLLEDMSAVPIFSHAPDSLDFDVAYTNTATAYQDVTITNTGAGTLNLTTANVSVIGPDTAMFEPDFGYLPLALSSYESGNIPVRYRPTAEGAHSATLRLTYGGVNYDIPLSGRAVGSNALVESFEGELFPPLGWAVYNGGGSQTWQRSTTKPRNGVAHAYLHNDSKAHNDWLITPKLAPSATNHLLRFYGCNNYSSGDNRFNVLVSTTTPDIASFTHVLATNVQTGSTNYVCHTYDLSGFIGQEVFIAIQAISSNQMYLLIDDILGPDVVECQPSIPVLLSPANSSVMASLTPTLCWSPNAGGIPTGYKLYFGTDYPPATEYADVTNTHFTFTTDLQASTIYYWTVKAYNNEGTSDAAPVYSFTTEGWLAIGLDTTYGTSFPTVYGGAYKNAREQYIITAAELTAAGAQQGEIHSIGFNVYDHNACGSLPNFTISMRLTDATEFANSSFLTDLTEVYSVDGYTPYSGWNGHPLDTPFYWDGVSNLLIQASFDMKTSGTYNANTYFTTTPAYRALYYSSTNYDWNTASTGARSYYRPNMVLDIIYTEGDLPIIEGFDTTQAGNLPEGWANYEGIDPSSSVAVTAQSGLSSPNSVQLSCGAGDSDGVFVIMPPLNPHIDPNQLKISFAATTNGFSDAGNLDLGVMSNPEDISTFALLESFAIDSEWQSYSYDFTAYTGTARHIAFRNAGTGTTVLVDDVTVAYKPANDLATTAIDVSNLIYQNQSTVVKVEIQNKGRHAQGSYTVELWSTTETSALTSVAGPYLRAGESKQVQFNWSPTQSGSLSVYAKVILAGDEDETNDASAVKDVYLVDADHSYHEIGNGNNIALVPMNFNYKSSLSQNLYLQSEIGRYSNIHAVTLYNSFQSAINAAPLKIWMGTSTRTNLQNQHIPYSEMTLVFDGYLNFPAGDNRIVIDLDTPFAYTQDNLVIMYQRPLGAQSYDPDSYFKGDSHTVARCIHWRSNTVNYDPATFGFTSGSISNMLPQTGFVFEGDLSLAVAPVSLDFGNVVVGNTYTDNVHIVNDGIGAITISQVSFSYGYHFEHPDTPLPLVLGLGEEVDLGVQFSVNEIGNYNDTMKITTSLGVYNIPLHATAWQPPLMAYPDTIRMGLNPPLAYTSSRILALTPNQDIGMDSVPVDSILVTGASEFSLADEIYNSAGELVILPYYLTSGDSLKVQVDFLPLTPEVRTATINVYSGGEVVKQVHASAFDMGIPVIEVTPKVIFHVLEPNTGTTGSFTICNHGDETLHFSINTADFGSRVTFSPAAGSVPVDGELSVSYTIASLSPSQGLRAYTLKISSNDLYTPVVETPFAFIALEPIANRAFTAYPTQGALPLTVQFRLIPPVEGLRFNWDFDNNGSFDSYDPEPVHTYTETGTYSVRLVVLLPTGATRQYVMNNYITVGEVGLVVLPDAVDSVEFYQYQSGGPYPLSEVFSAPPGTVLRYRVHNSDHVWGSVNYWGVMTLYAASHWWGTETVTVTATDQFGNTASHQITVTVIHVNIAPNLNIPSNIYFIHRSTCAVDFSQYIRDVDNDLSELSITLSRISGDESIEFAYSPINEADIQGQHTVIFSSNLETAQTARFKIDVNDNYSRAISSAQFNVHVLDQFNATMSTPTTYRYTGQSVRFKDATLGNPNSWFWDFGDGNTSTEQHPIHAYQAAGNYTVSLTVKHLYPDNTVNEEASVTNVDYITMQGTSVTQDDLPPTWNPAGSPYNLFGGVTVDENTTIEIEEDVTVNIFGDEPMTIEGTLTANNVTFAGPDEGGWGGLIFGGGSRNGSNLTNCTITDAALPLKVVGSSPTFSGITINNTETRNLRNTEAAIFIGQNSGASFQNVEIDGYSEGIVIDNDGNLRFTPTLSHIRVRNSTQTSRDASLTGTGLSLSGSANLYSVEVEGFETGIDIKNLSSASAPSLRNISISNGDMTDPDGKIGAKVSGNVGINNLEVAGYNTGVHIYGTQGSTATPTLVNIRIRNSAQTSRDSLNQCLGLLIDSDAAPNIEDLEITNMPRGILIQGDESGSSRLIPTLNSIRVHADSLAQSYYGLAVKDMPNVSINDAEIEGYENGIQIRNTSTATSTPTLTYIRVRNSAQTSRADRTGVDIFGKVAANLSDVEVQDYPFGIRYQAEPYSTSNATPTLTHIRVRNSTQTSRSDSYGIQLIDLDEIEMDDVEIEEFHIGLELNNTQSFRTVSTPTLTHIRVRNSTQTSRLDNMGILLGNDIGGSLTDTKIENAQVGIMIADRNTTDIQPLQIFNCATGIKSASLADTVSIKGHLIVNQPDFIAQHQDWDFTGFELMGAGPWTINNNTIVGTRHYLKAVDAQGSFLNNICFSDPATDEPFILNNSNFSITYNNLATSPPQTTEGNISGNPMFNNASEGDYTLSPYSPCIDAGSPDEPLDADGTTSDMGAFTYLHRASFQPIHRFVTIGTEVQFTNTSEGHNHESTTVEWDLGNDGVVDATSFHWNHTFDQPGIYDLKLTMRSGNLTDVIEFSDYIVVQQHHLPPPANVQLNIVNGNLQLSWDAVNTTVGGEPVEVPHYLIYASDDPYGFFEYQGYTTDGETSYTSRNHVTGHRFFFVIGFSGTYRELLDYIDANPIRQAKQTTAPNLKTKRQ